MVKPLQLEAQRRLRNAQAKLHRCHLLDRVSLVEDREIIRENKAAGFFLRLITLTELGFEQRKKQRVIHHDQARIGSRLAGFLKKTISARPAMPRRANVRLAANLQPHADLRLKIEITERAVAGFFRPFANRLELFIFRSSEKIARLLERAA